METLPFEIKSVIVSFLDEPSRRVLRLANMQWFNITRYDSFEFIIKRGKEDLLQQIFQRLQKYRFPIGLKIPSLKQPLTLNDSEELGKITQLTKLYVYCSTMQPTSIEVLGRLTNLTNLAEVNLPSLSFEIIQHYTNLRKLQLAVELLSEPDLSRFSKLDSVTWQDAQDKVPDINILAAIYYPHHITKLDLRLIPLDKLDPLRRFTNLKQLHLKINWKQTDDWLDLPYLPNLETLSMEAYRIGDLQLASQKLTYLHLRCASEESCHLRNNSTRLTNLQWLTIEEGDLTGLIYFTNLTSLTILKCTSEVLPIISEHLTQLKTIEIVVPYATEQDLHVSKMTSLQHLSFTSRSSFDYEEVQYLPLTYLELSMTVGDDLLNTVSTLTDLKELELRNATWVTDNGVLDLTNLQKLTLLRLQNVTESFTGVNLTLLTTLNSLDVHYASGAHFSNDPNEFFSRLSYLTNLYIIAKDVMISHLKVTDLT